MEEKTVKISDVIDIVNAATNPNFVDMTNTVVYILALVVSVGTLIYAVLSYKSVNRAYINVEIYCMGKEVYAVIRNIGNLDAYNVSVTFKGMDNAHPFECISMINRGVSYRSVLMSRSSIRNIQNDKIHCCIEYNDLYKKKRCHTQDFHFSLTDRTFKSLEYNKELDTFDISIM